MFSLSLSLFLTCLSLLLLDRSLRSLLTRIASSLHALSNRQKNVEKKRRETINDGIKRLSNLVPGADKNKSKIINQAAEYIAALKDNEASNIEKWTLDKLMTEKTIRDLQAENERMRGELQDYASRYGPPPGAGR